MVEVVAALIRSGNKVLICQRSEKQSRALKWEFPGGKIEKGETPREALVRECSEELGISVSVGELVSQNTCVYPDISIRLSLYETQIERGIPLAIEHAECRFVEPAEFSSYAFCEADAPFLSVVRNERSRD